MIRFDADPSIGVINIGHATPDEELYTRARQVSQFMIGIQSYYTSELRHPNGEPVRRIDTDPPPNPHDPRDTDWRIERFRAASSGSFYEDELLYMGAFRLDATGTVSKDDFALQGLLVLKEHDRVDTEIVEWHVVPRGQGLGRFLLREGLRMAHPATTLRLDVMAANIPSRAIYEHYGFEYDQAIAPMNHGIFDGPHLQMFLPGGVRVLQEQLGIQL